MKITTIRKNIMGTISFEAKFNGMRKSQEFIVYPISKIDNVEHIVIQSDTRIGRIYLDTGLIMMSAPRSGGAYSVHLAFSTNIDKLNKEELSGLKFRIFQTAGDLVGSSIVKCDNSNANMVAIF